MTEIAGHGLWVCLQALLRHYGAMPKGRRIRVKGQVQGVGFRPFVWNLAKRFSITGRVSNDAEGVLILAQGANLSQFEDAITSEAPPLARVDAVQACAVEMRLATRFEIVSSGPTGADTHIPPDAATCMDCRMEMTGQGRRSGYAFTNCTNCGPRYTILRHLPYDRARTTMAPFEMCDDCRTEYSDPQDRRFHAQPIACPKCGPALSLIPPAQDPIAEAAHLLLAGGVVAIKGLGGFHIACDATNPTAIDELRRRKRRPTKPFAVMASEQILSRYASPHAAEWTLLNDPAAPIVLIAGRAGLPDTLAPGLGSLGWMLPYTPLHHLLLAAVDRPLVMTSGNLSGEPQVIGNEEALAKLGHLVEATLLHDRDIARRLDDSLERLLPSGLQILRRARGRVPGTLPLPEGFSDQQVVAYGAHLKSAICLTKNGQALLSHHLGDLDDPLTWEEFVKADADYAELFEHAPIAAACDLHPDYRSSQHARAKGLTVIEVQHHHAHLASCLAENAWPRDGGSVAGIILDGLGLGTDGTIWGGEVLLGDYSNFERRAWLRPAPLPGGDAASRAPWRNLLARLDQAGMPDRADELLSNHPLDLLRQAVQAGINAPLSSSAGRLFDAFAAALGLVEDQQSYEGEAAMLLEALAAGHSGGGIKLPTKDGVIDPSLLFQMDWADTSEAAYLFHASLAHAFATEARALVENGDAKAVALSGGCFQNALLLQQTLDALRGVPVLIHNRVPANDGGLALGQALIALARLDGD